MDYIKDLIVFYNLVIVFYKAPDVVSPGSTVSDHRLGPKGLASKWN